MLKCFAELGYSAPLQDRALTDIPHTGNQAWKALVFQTRDHAVYNTLQTYLTANEIILMLAYCSKKKQMQLDWCWKLSPQNISWLQMLKCTEVVNIKVYFKDLQLISMWHLWYYTYIYMGLNYWNIKCSWNQLNAYGVNWTECIWTCIHVRLFW